MFLTSLLVPGRTLQPSLMFEGKAGASPSEAPFKSSTLGRLLAYLQSFDEAGKACQGHILQINRLIDKLHQCAQGPML